MKKTMKRFLTAALVMAMVLTMVMVPVSAANTVTETVVLMDQDLSTIKNSMIVNGTWGQLEGQPTYADGTEWGSDWGAEENARIGFNGGFNTLAGTWEEGKESVFSRKIFARMPIKKLNDDLTFTYDITTGPQYRTKIYTIAFINDEKGPQLFGYDASTLKLGFGGYADYSFGFADETLVDLQPNTDYTVTVKLAYDKSAACYDLIGNVKGGTGEYAIDTTIIVDNYERAKSSADFSAVGFRMANGPAISEETPVTVLNIKNMKIEESYERVVTDFDLKKDFTLMDQDLSTIKNSMLVDGTWGKLSEQPTYADGTEWGSDWGVQENARIGFTGGFNTLAGTWEASRESVFSRKIFARMPIKKLNDDLTFTYDITTGPQYPTQIYTIAFINDEKGPQLFGYNAKTLQLGFGGRGDYAFDFANETLVDLQPNTGYTVTVKLAYDKSAACYDLIGNVKGGTGENAIDTTITVDNYERAKSSADFSAVGFRMANSDAINEPTPVTVLNIKNMKIVENARGHIINFDDAKYDKHSTMIDTSLNSDISNAVATDDSEYTNGNKWGTNLPENIGTAFTASEGTISACFVREESGKPRDVSKKFVPVTDGEVLKVSGDVKMWTPYSQKSGEWNRNTIELVGADNSRLVLFGGRGTPSWWEFVILHQGDYANGWVQVAGTQQDVRTTGTARPDSSTAWAEVIDNDTVFDDIGDVPNGGKNSSSMEGVVNFTVTAAPNASDSSKYDVTLTFNGQNIKTTSVKTVDKAFVQKLDAIKIHTYSGWTSDAAATQVRNLKVEKYPNVMKDGFVKGTNTLYLPIENVTGHEATYAIIAAVCDKTSDEQKNFFIRQYPDNGNALDNLAIDVEISDPATEYVKFYVFNGYDSLVPYTTPISLGK